MRYQIAALSPISVQLSHFSFAGRAKERCMCSIFLRVNPVSYRYASADDAQRSGCAAEVETDTFADLDWSVRWSWPWNGEARVDTTCGGR